MSWKDNVLMLWDGVTVTDHNRAALTVSVERVENSKRMANGRMRRWIVAKKKAWTASWENLPSNNTSPEWGTVDTGMSGEQIETWHNTHDGPFTLTLRKGTGVEETFTVMITDFSKEITKRGPQVDLWTLSITLTEV